MPILQAAILGFVQGLTEFLPISSSGFLILVPQVLGWEPQDLAFDALLHLATLTAIVIALWPELKQWRSIAWWIFFATIPAVLVGLILVNGTHVEFRSAQVVGWSFVVWGLVLFVADRYAKPLSDDVTKVGWKRAMLIGLAQAIALIPGTSRSGITITAGLFGGLSRQTAAKFSFLLGIPTIAAGGLFNLVEVIRRPSMIDPIALIVGFVVAFVTALGTIRLFLKFLEKNTYREIALLRVVLGVLILVLL